MSINPGEYPNCSLICFRGNTAETRGTAFVIYEDIFDAKNACEHLSGFNVSNRYLVVSGLARLRYHHQIQI